MRDPGDWTLPKFCIFRLKSSWERIKYQIDLAHGKSKCNHWQLYPNYAKSFLKSKINTNIHCIFLMQCPSTKLVRFSLFTYFCCKLLASRFMHIFRQFLWAEMWSPSTFSEVWITCMIWDLVGDLLLDAVCKAVVKVFFTWLAIKVQFLVFC